MEYQPVTPAIDQGNYLSFRPGARLKKAREKRTLVLRELSYNLNSIDVEESVKFYHQALLDIEGNPEAKLNLMGQILALISYYIPSKKKLFFKIVFLVKILIGKSKKLNIFYIFLIIKISNGNANSNLIKYLKKKFQMFEIDFKSFRAIFYKGDIDECK